jgi:N-acetylneuraminic acid mutarotase
MPTIRTHAARAVAGGRLYVIGGLLFQAGPSSAFERYDPSTDRWEMLPRSPLRIDHAMAAAIGDTIVVAGGSYASGTTRALRYDIARGAWSEIAPLPEPLAAGGAASIGEQVYVFGGISSGSSSGRSSAYAYDGRAGAWRRLMPMPTPRHHLAVAVYRGEVCALGGRGATAERAFECYVPAADRWERKPDLPVPMEDFDVAAVGDELWAFPAHGGAYFFDVTAWHVAEGPPGVDFGHVAAYVAPWVIVVNASSVAALRVR